MGYQQRQEEITVSIDRRVLWALLVILILAAIVGLGVLGKAFTPVQARVIGRSDWQALKVEQKYRRELTELREDLADLADLVKGRPDPVRTEMAAARYAQNHADGLGLLEYQRDIVLTATEVVRDWAAGYETHENAVAVVNLAVEALEKDGREEILAVGQDFFQGESRSAFTREYEGGPANGTSMGSSSDNAEARNDEQPSTGSDEQTADSGDGWWADLDTSSQQPDW